MQVPGDKSISHRALIFSTLASGTCKVSRLSPAEDCQSTIKCLRALGLKIEEHDGIYEIVTSGPGGLSKPSETLNAGNSGTTIRLMAGLAAGLNFTVTFDGDSSLRKRPMGRVLSPLCEMGLKAEYPNEENYPPFAVTGGHLQGKDFKLNVASAQVQTALMLAGLQSDGVTTVSLPSAARSHTEKMFEYIGVPFEVSADGLTTSVKRLDKPVTAYALTVPGDISSAAFFMVAAACAPGSHVRLSDVGLNVGRTLVIDVLREMGADIVVEDEKLQAGEPVGTIVVKGTRRLKGTTIAGDRIAAGIDEIPILALAGAFCEGVLSVRDAAELRVKESDRLTAISNNLRAAGCEVKEYDDGFDVHGQDRPVGGSDWQTFGDHRLAMTGLIASLLCQRPIAVDDTACAAVSYPTFQEHLSLLTKQSIRT